jgi:hypothetical protein
MDFKFLLDRLTGLLFSPAKAFESIHSGDKPLKEIRISYLFPLLLLLALTSFTGSMFIANKELSFFYSLLTSLSYIVLILLVTWLSALILKETTYALDLGRDYQVSYRLIVYSLTPLYLCLALSSLFESLIFIDILALYSLYIFWDGMRVLLNPPEHKRKFLLIVTTITVLALFAGLSIFLNLVMERFYNAFFA